MAGKVGGWGGGGQRDPGIYIGNARGKRASFRGMDEAARSETESGLEPNWESRTVTPGEE